MRLASAAALKTSNCRSPQLSEGPARAKSKCAGIGVAQFHDQSIALATEIAPTASPATLARLDRASMPKPKNSKHAQEIRMVMKGQDRELFSCNEICRCWLLIDVARSPL